MTSLGTTSKPADTGSAMGPEMGLEVGRRPSGCPATRPRHARTLTGHGRHKFGRFSSWPGPASRSIKLKNALRPRLSGLTKMHRRSACDPALESSRQRRQGELSQASIEVVHVEILMVAKTPGGPIKSVRLSLVLQRIWSLEHGCVPL